MRRLALAAIFATASLAAAAAAEKSGAGVEVVRGPYLVADAKTGEVIQEFDALRPWYPASTSKLVTMYVTFEAIRDGEISLDTEIGYSRNAADQPPSKMGFRPGSTLTLDDALKIMMVKSANDIAVAVAEAVGGSVEGFAARMNAAAAKLGMTRSHFVNPHGLPDPGQVSTARDMALVAQALLREFPERRRYFSIHAIEYGGKVMRNFNRLIDRFPGATGMKTGFICSSGYNLVASAERDGRSLIAVVFGAYGGKMRNEEAAALLDSAFSTPQRAEPETTLLSLKSGEAYTEPLDMRPQVCGPERAETLAALSGGEDSDEDAAPTSHLTAPMDFGPPIKVTAYIPAQYGEPGFVARLPRPRPGPQGGPPEVLPAFAPVHENASATAPAEAIGTAVGDPAPLQEVAPQ
jgi:D-alanyl-D-alanine carboxypeptidase